ncbi:phosphotransferase [Vibrio salinus]|uniref:phosphotransferase n=1 Tax=Vibrio salinus TaxID=2899784 RepID=UPI001E528F83|nr:phosphotransferase [Vibrio salinus]MCE0492865.1 phosphotransferase [Vibrio salinus]
MARIPWDEACTFDSSLSALGKVWGTLPSYAETLSGGLTNRCWKIYGEDGKPYIWRPVTDLTRELSISRQQEYQILSALQKNAPHLAPKPISRQPEGILVEWIEGDVITELSEVDIVRLLSDIHRQDCNAIPVSPFNYTARIDHYWLILESGNENVARFESIYHSLRVVPPVSRRESVLCHFDLGVHNIIRSRQGLKVIDWEYASIADPRIDIAMTVFMENADLVKFVARYCKMNGLESVNDWINGVKAWMPRVYFMAFLWYLVAYHHGCGDDYLTWAEELFPLISDGSGRN